jgi:hypothetical protein
MAHPPQELIMELTTATPVEIDTEIAKLSVPLHRAQVKLAWLQSTDFRNRIIGTDAQIAEQQAKIDEALDAIAPFDAEFVRRGGWSRFFLVTNNNGHIHRTQACSTTYATTQWAWLPQLSGQTEAEAVEDQGEILCSVCFPSAPSAWTNGVSKRTKEEREQRAAEKAQRDAKKAEKGITAPDGSPLRTRRHGEIKTARTAEIEAAGGLADDAWYGFKHPSRDEWLEGVVQCVEALAAKRGVAADEVWSEIQRKAVAKCKRDGVLSSSIDRIPALVQELRLRG